MKSPGKSKASRVAVPSELGHFSARTCRLVARLSETSRRECEIVGERPDAPMIGTRGVCGTASHLVRAPDAVHWNK